MNAANKERPSIDEENLPDFFDKICTQHSATFNTIEFRREAQAFDYRTPEWEASHKHARNSIESVNAQAKSGEGQHLQAANRRRVRGFSAAQLVVTVLLANFNLRKSAAFISDEIKAHAQKRITEPRVRRPDRDWHNPYTGTYPPEVTPPGTPPPQSPSDETGGPPLRA